MQLSTTDRKSHHKDEEYGSCPLIRILFYKFKAANTTPIKGFGFAFQADKKFKLLSNGDLKCLQG